MKRTLHSLPAFLLVLLAVSSAVWAMPPHPDLLARIKDHSVPEPYSLQHRAELLAEGVDAPGQIRTIDMLRRRSLDDNINILAILVDFSDHTSRVQPVYFDSLLYGNHTGTLNDYYQQVSYGNLTLITLNMPSALGWQRAPQTYAYYVNDQNGEGTYPQNAQRLTEDCVHMVDSLVDFSQYDNNGDGHVEALFIIHSGPGAEFTGRNSDIWSHSWTTHSPQYMDGVVVDRYSMEPEYWQSLNDMTCGVFAHEMGHAVFGLPDLYDVTYNSEGLGTWTLMAGGSWNGQLGNSPAHPDAWCRIQMGFATPTNVTANLSHVSIPYIEHSPVVYRLWADGMQGNEYFLVENRQQHGYDLHLRGSGLLIYHVDESVDGNTRPWYPGHASSGHYQVALEQADGRFDLERNSNSGDSEDPYPSWDSLSFTNGTTPNSRSYAGGMTRVTVRNISTTADTMTADLAVRAGAGNLVFVQLPDTNAIAGDTIWIPVVIDSITGQNVTSFRFVVSCDSTAAEVIAPFFSTVGGLIPETWSMSQNHSLGVISVVASGATPLSGQGLLLSLKLHVLPNAPEGVISSLVFLNFVFNQGQPPVDLTNGSLTVSAAHILLQPGSVSFGNVGIGQQATRTVIVRNNGNAVLSVTSMTVSAPFSTDFSPPMTVPAGGWSHVQIAFSPDTVGLYRDSLTIMSNASEGVVRMPVSGQGVSLGMSDTRNTLPTQFALSRNFPNPFNPSTWLSYDVPRSARVTITVYDVLGRMIDTPVNGVIEPGHHHLEWSCPSCGSGIYLFVMSAEGTRYLQKAFLLK